MGFFYIWILYAFYNKIIYVCSVCGFDFEKVYGELGESFIEVHHNKPLFTLGGNKEVIIDLDCVCSNCHRMLHKRRNEILTVEELRKIVNKNKIK